ncbi:carboxypeptidase-like regulatory domain-containing protein [Terriglobus albidus]|uniref:carboxypeptidase-like regulatory domain-containing protein n=1 Tax=Terriglobus albidus TaxID=1592106 RepID=UPI0021E0CF1D|nr:carboxypeptidase-like regulatory domain-containing protein [Terriglobus albidus]
MLKCAASVFLLVSTTALSAQQAGVATASFELPDAPAPQFQTSPLAASPSQALAALPAGSAQISGSVFDSTGAIVPGAQVTLLNEAGAPVRSELVDTKGGFLFVRLPAGSYRLRITCNGFAPYISPSFDVSGEQNYVVPDVSLTIASTNTEITVLPTEVIAEAQIKAQEQQRVFGVIPNFYTSFEPHPVPMTTKQKFQLATRDTLDWTSFIGVTVSAGVEQANNSYAGYGQGAAGYGKRWAARFGDGRISDYFDHAIYASLFHQDPRYFYQGIGSTKSRVYHAIASAFVARSDSGNMMPNYSYLLGAMTSGALSNLYYPHADRGWDLVFTNAAIGIGGRAAGAVARELLGRKITKHVPGKDVPYTDPANTPAATH